MTTEISDLQVSENLSEPLQRAEVDAASSAPVLFFFASAFFWLLTSTTLYLVSTLQLQVPEFLASISWLTFGRLLPAHLNIATYGWASMAGIGTALWIMARLSRIRLQHRRILVGAGILWNIGILVGVLGILSGNSTSVEGLEFPRYAAIILFAAYVFIGIWTVVMFSLRRPGHIYISQWYIIAAFFCFPWTYTIANIFLIGGPVQGVIQSIVASWYGNNLFWLWLTPLALASCYYLIPKATGKTIHGYGQAFTGFWLLALFASWSGVTSWINGPIPAWLITVSIIAKALTVIPIFMIASNLLGTAKGFTSFKQNPSTPLRTSPALRFTIFGVVCFVVFGFLGAFLSFRSVNRLIHFTYFNLGHSQLAFYGFLMMTFLGAMYFILPRLMKKEWPSLGLARAHFWIMSLSVVLLVGDLMVGGLIQGSALSNEKVSLVQISQMMKPYLLVWSVSVALMLFGQLVFAASFIQMLLSPSTLRQAQDKLPLRTSR